ncbi:transcription factor Ovo-like 2 [Cloeon dipterum]|uniref:transcription factor Ovo-like 2 n=1 Tax=Cloeon dipterum TaxID=197152 RepID=UPI0032201821
MDDSNHLHDRNLRQRYNRPEFVLVGIIKEEPLDEDLVSSSAGQEHNEAELSPKIEEEQEEPPDPEPAESNIETNAPSEPEEQQEAQAVLTEPIEVILQKLSSVGRYNDRVKCPCCSKELANRWVLARHIKSLHLVAQCDKKLNTFVKRESKEKHICKFCNKAMRPKEVSKHMRVFHPNDYQQPASIKPKPSFFCAHCSYSGHRRNRMVLHVTAKHFPKTVACPDCPAIVATRKELIRHKYRRHSTWNCSHCGKNVSKANFTAHLIKSTCQFCDEVSNCCGQTALHRKVCKKKAICPHCERDFHNRDNLRKHVIICPVRTGEPMFEKVRPSRAFKGTYKKKKKRGMLTREDKLEEGGEL